ncbi:MAG: Uma2 family endonuclease [Planctomycetota bacterium]|nr:Uma2 family endonuclease [Planctomycetota bacterium]
MPIVVLEPDVVIPSGIETLADFRRWATADDFPERGRVDYIAGQIEVDMSPNRITSHGLAYAAIITELSRLVNQGNLGQVLPDNTLIVSDVADLACEPDLSFISWDSLRSGRVRYVTAPKAGHESDYLEVYGGPDLVVEIVSPSSVAKDTKRLPPAYFAAGVREFWLVDAREAKPKLIIHKRGGTRFEPVEPGADGFHASGVLAKRFRLTRRPGPVPNTVVYRLESR